MCLYKFNPDFLRHVNITRKGKKKLNESMLFLYFFANVKSEIKDIRNVCRLSVAGKQSHNRPMERERERLAIIAVHNV